jgi:hypothetical protein
MQLRKNYTAKQMADAGEMLIAAELTLAGVPSLRVPDLWPGYYLLHSRWVGSRSASQ